MGAISLFQGYRLQTLLLTLGLCILYGLLLSSSQYNFTVESDFNPHTINPEPSTDNSTKLSKEDRQSNRRSTGADHKQSSERSQHSAVNRTQFVENYTINADHASLDASQNEQRIFYNRAPKCGSSVTGGVISQLSISNNFTYSNSLITNRMRVSIEIQKEQCKYVSRLKAPALYNRHLLYIDCTKFGDQALVFINLVRDPVERYISWYSFHRSGFNKSKRQTKPEKKFAKTLDERLATKKVTTGEKFHIISFFCGQDDFCYNPRSKEEMDRSLAQAKEHILQYFPVVGVHEDMPTFFRVLEKRFPRFFTKAIDSYSRITEAYSAKYSSKRKEHLKESLRSMLASELHYEYDLYNFIKQRFYQQAKSFAVIQ